VENRGNGRRQRQASAPRPLGRCLFLHRVASQMRLSKRRLCGLARLVRAERVDRAQRQNSLYGTEAVLDDPRFLAATAKPHPKPGTSSSKTRISDCPGFSLIRATFCSVSRISVGGSNLSERANKISRLTGPTLPRINRKKRAGQTRGRSSRATVRVML
jgi:hypothetical protein